MTGIELISKEREEQINKHGRTIEYDSKNNMSGQLSQAAGLLTYMFPEEVDGGDTDNDNILDFTHCAPEDWDIDLWNKMMNKSYKDRLIIAGAMIAAEIDLLNYTNQ